MHTCIAYSSCIILTLCFAAIIDPSSCIWERKGGRLVRIVSKSPTKQFNLEATRVMEPQQKRNWNLEDIKEALMDDMRAMMQDKLRQALAGLLPPPAAVNPPVVDAQPVNHENAGGQPLNIARNVPTVEMKFEDAKNFMVEKVKKESLELFQDLESKQMKALAQKMTKMEELMRGQGMGYSFDFDDMMQLDGDKLPDKFKMPQL